MVATDRGEDGSGMAIINFERKSENAEDLLRLLKKPVDDFKKHVESMIVHLRTGGIS
jgi:hypothetical protein